MTLLADKSKLQAEIVLQSNLLLPAAERCLQREICKKDVGSRLARFKCL
jgi:hypothetical protein